MSALFPNTYECDPSISQIVKLYFVVNIWLYSDIRVVDRKHFVCLLEEPMNVSCTILYESGTKVDIQDILEVGTIYEY